MTQAFGRMPLQSGPGGLKLWRAGSSSTPESRSVLRPARVPEQVNTRMFKQRAGFGYGGIQHAIGENVGTMYTTIFTTEPSRLAPSMTGGARSRSGRQDHRQRRCKQINRHDHL